MNLRTLSKQQSRDNDCETIQIVDVWRENLMEEMANLKQLACGRYKMISLDTEFPGVVIRSDPNLFHSSAAYNYYTLSTNVNCLKIIQLGICLTDDEGNVPEDGRCCWQFNFQFDLTQDLFAADSIHLLQSSGINFSKHQSDGIDALYFGQLLLNSGVLFNHEMKWLSFHGAYDFGYLLRLVTNQYLPADEKQFFDLIHSYFPSLYDVKYIMRSCEGLKGGLSQLAADLNMLRIGTAHQAGSDCLLTASCYLGMIESHLNGVSNLRNRCNGVLFGLGIGSCHNNSNHYTSSRTASPPSPGPSSNLVDTNWPALPASKSKSTGRTGAANKKKHYSQQRSKSTTRYNRHQPRELIVSHV